MSKDEKDEASVDMKDEGAEPQVLKVTVSAGDTTRATRTPKEGGTEPVFRDDAQASVNEYFNERIYEAPELTEEGRNSVRKVLGEMVLGKPRWTEKDHENARRWCPTCGTPACNHPDRIRGEDALPIPPEALSAGGTMVQNFLPQYDWRTCEMIAEGIFREMLEKCSK